MLKIFRLKPEKTSFGPFLAFFVSVSSFVAVFTGVTILASCVSVLASSCVEFVTNFGFVG